MKSPVVRVVVLNTMPLAPIWTRLGYREKTADRDAILPKYQPVVQRFVNETRVRIFFREQPLTIDTGRIGIGDYHFTSQLIAERFRDAQSVYLLGASVEPADYQRLRELQAMDTQQAVILDAVLSEKVDYALDFLEKELAVELRRTGRKSGQRLSCGYGDFQLENQPFFYQALEFMKYGITINERFILSPEKTVTAVLPVYFYGEIK